ncbi:hypothetical protein CERSUDRAFT_98097 [Gelatoporia subvermispora B]|uniref:Uncharacterized protein n=1 Tax=Ceriporiopsis subvermispora (strain B) TaxID=914234 RepID=M2PE73_CERS8|nr:hypothetical protein CERSUDRAFT_98097 [Gelatoporia subvermispora B]
MRYRLQGSADYMFDSIFNVVGEDKYAHRHHMDWELDLHLGYRFVFGASSQVFADLTPREPFDSDTFHNAVVTKLEDHRGWAWHWLRESSTINSYFYNGGNIIYALDCLTAMVEPECEGSGDPQDDSLYECVRAHWTLPQRRHDREIDTVGQNLGSRRDKEWDPYNEKRFIGVLIRHDPASDMEFDDSEDEEWTSEDE